MNEPILPDGLELQLTRIASAAATEVSIREALTGIGGLDERVIGATLARLRPVLQELLSLSVAAPSSATEAIQRMKNWTHASTSILLKRLALAYLELELRARADE